ncbi:MAG: 4Fe-4S binding protein [Gammaproteobacteria bacterium]
MDNNSTKRDSIKAPVDIALQIDEMQCLNLRARQLICIKCADTCSTKALALNTDEIRLDAEQCTACGACLPVCPSGALLLNEFDPRQFLETVAGTTELHIHCSQSDHAGAENIIPCLQVLDTRLLAVLAADGAEIVVLHGTDLCSNCTRGDARAAIEQMQVELKKWFTHVPLQFIQKKRIQRETAEPLKSEQVQLSRRNFLRFASVQVAHGATQWLADDAPKQEKSTSRWPLFSSDTSSCQPSVYQALLAEKAELLPWRDHLLPWHSRLFSDDCNNCLTCAQHCPTGALVTEGTKSTISIWFHLHLCTDCGLCEQLCPESAISTISVASAEVLSAPAYRLMFRRLRQCAGCANNFVPGLDSAELCMTCQNEQDMMNDWKDMLL